MGDKFNRYLNRLSVYFLSLHQLFYKEKKIKITKNLIRKVNIVNEMKIKEKLLNKFRNSFSKIRILKQLKLNQNKLKQFKLCSNKIKITKIKLQNKFKKLFKKKVQIRKLNQKLKISHACTGPYTNAARSSTKEGVRTAKAR